MGLSYPFSGLTVSTFLFIVVFAMITHRRLVAVENYLYIRFCFIITHGCCLRFQNSTYDREDILSAVLVKGGCNSCIAIAYIYVMVPRVPMEMGKEFLRWINKNLPRGRSQKSSNLWKKRG